MRIGIIDLGTNTFNLLIADAEGNQYKSVHDSKIPVKLGEGGINNNHIAEAAFQRGLKALRIHKSTMDGFNVQKVFAFATSAIRGADNGMLFTQEAKKQCGFEITIISGEQEAKYIYEGVKKATDIGSAPALIMDIGGGSNEFVICNNKEIFWLHSYKLGVSRMLEKFNPSDPMTPQEIKALQDYVRNEMQELFAEAKKHNIHRLIGSAGSFDTFAEMVAHRFYNPDALYDLTAFSYTVEEYNAIHQTLLPSTRKERYSMKGMLDMRVDMIVLASIMVKLLVDELGITEIRSSYYSLKEGVLSDILQRG